MLDDAFTYGGAAFSLIAAGLWLWLACWAIPSFEAFVKGFEDELHLSDSEQTQADSARWYQIRQAAMVLTAVAALCVSIGFAIPD